MALSSSILAELRTYFMRLDAKNVISDSINPNTDNVISLGSPTKRYHRIYAEEVVADNIGTGAPGGDAENADTVDLFHAEGSPVAGSLLALSANADYPTSVYPMAILKDGSRTLEGNLSVTAGITIDGIDIGAHNHTGSSLGLVLNHSDLSNLNLDTQFAHEEDIIETWTFSNTADPQDDYYRYIGWKIDTNLTLNGGIPVPATTWTSISTLPFTDPGIGHDYHIGLKAHGNYSQITIGGSEADPDILLYVDDDETFIRVGTTESTALNLAATGSYLIYYGSNPATSVFSVDTTGKLISDSAEIGGWLVDSDSITSPTSPQGRRIELKASGELVIGDAGVADNSITFSAINPAGWLMWAGDVDATDAQFKVNTAGEVYLTAGIVDGYMRSGTYTLKQAGWKLSNNGDAEFNNIYARGRLETVVFSKRTISAASGIIDVSIACVIMEDMTDSQTYIVVDTDDFTANDICVLKPDENRLEWMQIASYAEVYGSFFKYNVIRGMNAVQYAFKIGETIVRRGAGNAVRSPFPIAAGEEGAVYGMLQPGGSGATTSGGWLTIDGIVPYFGVSARYGPEYAQYLEVVRIGNLKGVLSYDEETWGIFLGDSNSNLTYDQIAGLTIYSRGGATTISENGVVTDEFTLTKITASPAYTLEQAKLSFKADTGTDDLMLLAKMSSAGITDAEIDVATNFFRRENRATTPGVFTMGRIDEYVGGLNLTGDAVADGGYISLYNAGDSDTNYDLWKIESYNGDLRVSDGTVNYFVINQDSGTNSNHRLEVGAPSTGLTGVPETLIVANKSDLGTTLGNEVKFAEFQGDLTSSNVGRLRLTSYRREAPTTDNWKGAVWRFSPALDSSYTDHSKAYLDLGFETDGDGVIALGVGGADKIVVGGAGTLINSVNMDSTNEFIINIVIGSNLSTITTGVAGYFRLPYQGFEILGWDAYGEGGTGSIQVDLWVDTYANLPPVDADSITSSAPVAISTNTKNQDNTLTGWTKSWTATESRWMGVNVDSVSTFKRVTIGLRCKKK